MDPRLCVALPVLPAVAHAFVLRWDAAYLVDTWGAGWFEVADMLRALSVWVILFAVVLGALAFAARVTDAARAARWFLVVSLVAQVGWLAVLGFLYCARHRRWRLPPTPAARRTRPPTCWRRCRRRRRRARR
jgi:uncharacterized membrane protein